MELLFIVTLCDITRGNQGAVSLHVSARRSTGRTKLPVERSVKLTESEAESADQAEQQQTPDLLEALLDRAETTALSQLLPHRQPARPVHPADAHASDRQIREKQSLLHP